MATQLKSTLGMGAKAVPAQARPALKSAFRNTGSSRVLAFERVIASAAVGGADASVAPTPKTASPMNIVFVSTEVAPWSKTGGLGDVVGGLPVELAKRGHKVMTIAPRYDQYKDAWDTSVVINVMGEDVRFFHTAKKGVDRVWVDHPMFLAKVWGKTGSKLYGQKSGADYIDNPKRFRMFCEAAIEAARALPFGPGEDCIFVANDWHSAMVPVLLKEKYQPSGQFTSAKSVFTIHNIAFQGRFWPESLEDLELPPSALEKFDFTDGYPKVYSELTPKLESESGKPAAGAFPKVNWMKAGILSSDRNLTVSPNYATEITSSPCKGVELDKYLRATGIEGIVNGMDTTEWNPALDKYLDVKYNKSTVFMGKAAAKEALQAEVGLEVDPTVPLFGYIGRLEEQKGVDILMKALPKVLASGNVQVVILGTGKKQFETMVKALDKQFPGAKGVVKFSAPLAHMITAGADFLMVPSRFEPCGLIQLHAMQYGTVPVVSSTGGLVDTVKEGVTGFQMGAMDPDELLEEDADAVAATMERAAEVFGTPQYDEMVAACIRQDLSWKEPAKKWEGVLEEVMKGSAEGTTKKGEVQVPVALV